MLRLVGNLPLSAAHGDRAVTEQLPPGSIDRGVTVHDHVAIGLGQRSSTGVSAITSTEPLPRYQNVSASNRARANIQAFSSGVPAVP